MLFITVTENQTTCWAQSSPCSHFLLGMGAILFSFKISIKKLLSIDLFSAEILLFIESKFTEYLFPDNSSFAKKYLNFYANILPRIEGYPLRMLYPRKYDGKDGMGLEASSDAKLYSHLYMNGIKQCFSHLIGLCQGPDDDSCLQWGKFKGKIRFATILFYFPGDEFRAYRDFYSNTVGRITATDLKASIATIPEIKDNHTDHIEVAPAVYLYQDVFKDFELPKNIKKYYDL